MGDCPSPSSRSWWMEGECQSLMCLMAWRDIDIDKASHCTKNWLHSSKITFWSKNAIYVSFDGNPSIILSKRVLLANVHCINESCSYMYVL